MKRLHGSLLWILGIVLLGVPAGAQQQEIPVAEAARRARAQKKQQPQPARVWTNDNLPKTPGAVSIVGAGAPSAETGRPGEAAAAGAGPVDEESEKLRDDAEAKVKAEKEKLARAKRELDLMTREHQLLTQQFYGDPAQATNPTGAGRAQLEELGAQIETKKQEVAQIEMEVARLEDELKTVEQTLGPRREGPRTPDQDREAWLARLRPLREEIAEIDAQLTRIRADAARQGLSISGASGTGGGSMTADLINQLERRRAELQQQVAALEDEARRAGVPAGWLR